jgi:hypothetical protein
MFQNTWLDEVLTTKSAFYVPIAVEGIVSGPELAIKDQAVFDHCMCVTRR